MGETERHIQCKMVGNLSACITEAKKKKTESI